MMYALIAVFVIVLVVIFVFTARRNSAIQKDGIEADAVVSRIVENEERGDDGHVDFTYTYYVTYQTQDGGTVEAKLGNAPAHLFEGSALRVKYLPDKPKYVIPAK